ncbi:phosphatase PAP2 family protein [Knoellia aerolata]|nr:phosphatase PAP2 family protein [Knoellia aerolata]
MEQRAGSGRAHRGSTLLALGLVVPFLALTLVVATGSADTLDLRIAHHFRPTDAWWGDLQNTWSPWMSRLRPLHVMVLFATTVVGVCALRRSWWPMAFGATLSVAGVAALRLLQLVLARPDPHGYLEPGGGSYPSGHMLAVVVFLGGALLMVWPRVRWWWWASLAVPAGLMAAALVITVAHWPTDVLGGGLLALALVTGASRSTLRRLAHDR